MAELKIKIPEEIGFFKQVSDIDWSILASKLIKSKLDRISEVQRIVAKSKLTEDDVKEISDEINISLAKRYNGLLAKSSKRWFVLDRVVVDVNVVLSSLLTKGDSLKVFELNFLLNKFDFVAPEFLLTELERHKEIFLKRSGLLREEFDKVLDFITEQITLIPEEEFSKSLPRAAKLASKHLKDVQYVALALELKCPIFSGDKSLKELSGVEVLNPKELLSRFWIIINSLFRFKYSLSCKIKFNSFLSIYTTPILSM